MKRLFFLGLILSSISLMSCERYYTCELPSGVKKKYSVYEYNAQDVDAFKNVCISQGGTWE